MSFGGDKLTNQTIIILTYNTDNKRFDPLINANIKFKHRKYFTDNFADQFRIVYRLHRI